MKVSKKPACIRFLFLLGLLSIIVLFGSSGSASEPLRLHPENPHYFLFRGKPTLFITSGEHYGAVLNLDFDYRKYLRTLANDGLNGTRTWAGAYCEAPGNFNIASNTLAPMAGRFLCPWARSAQPGYANGGNKFDLTKWDEAYFKRLRGFLSEASKGGIIVELNLFCPFYDESMWRLSPMNSSNNINGVGNVSRTNVYTLDKNGGLLAIQDVMVRKLIAELKRFDNLYYEICNEPYFGDVTIEWQHHIADVISDTEKTLGVRHLISQNIANQKAKVQSPHPAVSIFNFHYASPPDTVTMNYGLDKVIGDNETGFRGTNEAPYRMEAWDFMVAGGGLFNHLDYSFVAGHEDGTFVYPASQPGGGTGALRKQLRFLRQTISKTDFVHMRPANELLKGNLPAGVTARVLANPGREYLIYLRTPAAPQPKGECSHQRFQDGEVKFDLTLAGGDFVADWLDTKRSVVLRSERLNQHSSPPAFSAPAFEDDMAIYVHGP